MIVKQRYKNFIEKQLQSLANYDSLRPEGHVYEFHKHSERVAQSVKNLALKLGYNDIMADALYWATLPHDIGKMALPVACWDLEDRPTEKQRLERRSHTWRGVEIIKKEFDVECETEPFLKLLIDIMRNHHEAVDGSGYQGKTGDKMTREVKMICICDAYDGWSVKRLGFSDDRDLSPKGVINRMETEKKGQFDIEILKSFKELTLCISKSYSLQH